MTIAEIVNERLKALGDDLQAAHLSRFFKTGKGEYGEGDRFLGVRCPQTRAIVKEFRKDATLGDVDNLTASPWHEVRLAGFLLLIEMFQQEFKKTRRTGGGEFVEYYLNIIDRGNNWDLVDMVAPKILGDWVLHHPADRRILHELVARTDSLWHQRVGMVSCWTLIRSKEFDDALELAETLIPHRHDLIHKASGWMLREIGKRSGRDELLHFLDLHAPEMPRTMLRYSIEKLTDEERRYYMALPRR